MIECKRQGTHPWCPDDWSTSAAEYRRRGGQAAAKVGHQRNPKCRREQQEKQERRFAERVRKDEAFRREMLK